MSKKLLLVLALLVLGNMAAQVASASSGPPPRCGINPNDPRCRPN